MQGLDPMLQQQLQQLEPEQMEKEILSMMGAFDNNQPEPVPMQPEAQMVPEIPMEGGEA